jgi:hypothetical protein
MKKNISQTIILAAITGWAALTGNSAHADDSVIPVQPEFPKIIS